MTIPSLVPGERTILFIFKLFCLFCYCVCVHVSVCICLYVYIYIYVYACIYIWFYSCFLHSYWFAIILEWFFFSTGTVLICVALSLVIFLMICCFVVGYSFHSLSVLLECLEFSLFLLDNLTTGLEHGLFRWQGLLWKSFGGIFQPWVHKRRQLQGPPCPLRGRGGLLSISGCGLVSLGKSCLKGRTKEVREVLVNTA